MGAAPFDAFAYAHAHRREVVWMSQNTNHLVPPEVFRSALLEAIDERRYEGYPPAGGLEELRELVRRDLRLPSEYAVFVSAGATESLYAAARALFGPGDIIVASDPTYLIIHRFLELGGARTENLGVYAPPYRLSADRVQAAITPATQAVLVIDPLNPLGSAYPRDELRAIAEIARDHRLLLLHDVTYRDFADAPANAFDFAPESTITFWSAAKNCGLAGLRLGGFAAPPELARRIARFNTNDLGVSILAQVAAVAGLSTKSQWFPAVREQVRANQQRIREVVARTPGTALPLFPSQANMFAIDVSGAGLDPDELQRELLLRHGVFVRSGRYVSLAYGHRFVRVSFSNPPSDIERFAAAFPLAVEALRAQSPAPSAR